jgi:NAD(P)-dependent dehydrogenase (short-subunit alcohol dehydrogenase family)
MTRTIHVVLGATGAVGGALARRLAAAGAGLVLGGRDTAALDALAAETGGLPCPGDATTPAAAEAAVALALERFGRLDGAANCVGSVLLKPAHLTKDEELQQVLAVNLWSAFHLVRAAVRAMDATGGAIALCSTAAVRTGLANHEAIAAAKGAVEGLARSAAATYAPRRIRVNCVAPGLVRSRATARITGSEAALKASVAMHALGRVGEPDDVAAALAWLLDPATTWVTGQVLGVDGGLGSVRARG